MITVVVSYFAWVIEFGMYRYFIPVEMLSFVAIFVCLQAFKSRIPIREFASNGRQLAIGALVGIVIISVAFEVPGSWGRSAWTQHYFSVIVPTRLTVSRSAFLMLGTNPNAYVIPFFPKDDYFAQVEGNLPPTPFVRQVISNDLTSYHHAYIIWSGSPPRHISPLALVASDVSAARSYGFRVDWKSCINFPSDVGATSYTFHVCQLTTV
jgi:hypothetical protein